MRWYLPAVGMALGFSSCGEDTVCPGHIDPIAPPSMQIQTFGPDSIAAIEVVEGPCKRKTSYSPYDASPGVPAVTIERDTGSAYFAGPGGSCTIELVSRDGRCVTVTAAAEYHEGPTMYHCTDNTTNCCPQSQVMPFIVQRWEFTESVLKISFADAPLCAGADAGVVDAAIVAADGVDAGVLDSAID
jgi:hypothetical protein